MFLSLRKQVIRMNKFIVFEGIDSSGKSTQIKLLESKFKQNKIDFCTLREPGGNCVSEKIREILLDKDLTISNEAETLLFLASRAQNTKDAIVPELNNKKFVICDRYADSTMAYQGYGKNIDKNLIKTCNDFATGSLKPALTIVLDLELKVSKNRFDGIKDRMEQNSDLFFNNVIKGYRELSKDDPKRYFFVNANQSIEKIHELIWDKIVREFNPCQ